MAGRLVLEDPLQHQPLTITLARPDQLEVIGHQRKVRPAHLKALRASVEHLGFVTPLVTVKRDSRYVIIDGQHRFQVGRDLGFEEFPVIVVPERLARRMMRLNTEQSLNIRERSAVALSIYREMCEGSPELAEDDGEVVDAIESAYLVTLGLAYERSGRLAGSAFEVILKKCDGFVDTPLRDAYEIRRARAEKILDAAKLVKNVEEALKSRDAWHSMARYQIISYANPTKRARKAVDFDKTFEKFISALEELERAPQRVLGERVD